MLKNILYFQLKLHRSQKKFFQFSEKKAVLKVSAGSVMSLGAVVDKDCRLTNRLYVLVYTLEIGAISQLILRG